ncbi:hypothetical protein OROGR_023930 [Orobanche gracilis]
MAAPRLAFFVVTTTLVIVGSYASTSSSTKDENPLEFTYSGARGPDRWASLDPTFRLCGIGKSQSPIDIITDRAVTNNKLKPLIREYCSVNVTLVNNKFTVAVIS